MNSITVGLEIMGMGMLGLFTAMIIIMGMTALLKKMDQKK